MSENKAEKTVTIIVDGTPHEVAKEKITFDEVVKLAYPDYTPGSGVTYSVTYKRGPNEKPEGILAPGGSVNVKKEMQFYVKRTGQS